MRNPIRLVQGYGIQVEFLRVKYGIFYLPHFIWKILLINVNIYKAMNY